MVELDLPVTLRTMLKCVSFSQVVDCASFLLPPMALRTKIKCVSFWQVVDGLDFLLLLLCIVGEGMRELWQVPGLVGFSAAPP